MQYLQKYTHCNTFHNPISVYSHNNTIMSDLISKQSIRKFSKLEWFARQVVAGFITGLHKSPFHGFSVEFSAHRHYIPGDSIKNIDWKLYGRTNKYFVKQYEEETNLRCQIVIDQSSSMYFPKDTPYDKIKFSIFSAAALTHLFRSQRDAIGLSLVSETVDTYLPPKLSASHIQYLYDRLEYALDHPTKGVGTNLASVLHQIADRTPKRSLILLFSDLLPKEEGDIDAFLMPYTM